MAVIVGNELTIPALPLERRDRGLLLEAARPITGDRRIQGGVRFCPIGGDTITAYDNTYCPPVAVPSDDPTSEAEATFNSFNIAADIKSPARWDAEVAQDIVGQRMSAMESAQVMSELVTGTITGNDALAPGVTHLVQAVTPVDEVLFVLEDVLDAWENVAFDIHASPGVFALLTNEYDIERGEESSGVYRTATGHCVTADAGMDGTLSVNNPADPGGADIANAANGQWIFASLPVHVWLGETRILGQGTGGLDMTDNTRTQVLERPAIVAFDPTVVVAVQVEVPTYTLVS